jgi:hypothetical protein
MAGELWEGRMKAIEQRNAIIKYFVAATIEKAFFIAIGPKSRNK